MDKIMGRFMENGAARRKRAKRLSNVGFTLIELMIVI
jgi:Tfp pilus assembly protein PilE